MIVQLLIAFALLVVSYAITSMMARKQATRTPASMEEFDFPQPDEGTAQIVVFGDVWIEDWMVLWYGDYRIEPITGRSRKK